MGEVLTRSAVKETTIWFVVGKGYVDKEVAEVPVEQFRSDTHKVTFHSNYISVAVIDKYGDESSRVWYPWHTIFLVEEKSLHRGGTVEIRSKFTVGEDTK